MAKENILYHTIRVLPRIFNANFGLNVNIHKQNQMRIFSNDGTYRNDSGNIPAKSIMDKERCNKTDAIENLTNSRKQIDENIL